VEPTQPTGPRDPALAEASTGELVARLLGETKELVQKQVDLAKTEVRSDVKREAKAAEGIGVAVICGIATFNMLLVAVVLAIAEALPGWGAALIVAAFMLVVTVVAGAIGWNKRVRRPLEKTEKTTKEDVQWTKQRLA